MPGCNEKLRPGISSLKDNFCLIAVEIRFKRANGNVLYVFAGRALNGQRAFLFIAVDEKGAVAVVPAILADRSDISLVKAWDSSQAIVILRQSS